MRTTRPQTRVWDDSKNGASRVATAIEACGFAVWEFDGGTGRVWFSEAWNVARGDEARETTLPWQAALATLHPSDRRAFRMVVLELMRGMREAFVCECRVRTRTGTWNWIEARGRAIERDGAGSLRRLAGTTVDIGARKNSEKRMRFLATRDALTGLPNRTSLNERLNEAIRGARRRGDRLLVLFVDLDRFKIVNDSLGHPAGDALLRAAAKRLGGVLRPDSTLARMGGDEFVVVVPRVEGLEPLQVPERLRESLAEPISVDGHQLRVCASIGAAVFPDDGIDSGALTRCADTAMYDAKEAGGNTVRFFTPSMTERAQSRMMLESRLHQAVERDEFEVYYQPQFDLRTQRVVGFEALARWHHADLGAISPDRFIPIAEQSGLIVQVGEWVLQRACRQLRGWRDRGFDVARIGVNVSAHEFRSPNFYERVVRALAANRLEPYDLELEITESALMDQSGRTVGVLHRLNAIGVHLAIDDFGTGYSNLRYLQRYPIGRLKIDRSFIAECEGGDPAAETLLGAIVAMAHQLRLPVVAEGVETPFQRSVLERIGCDHVQGHLFGVPAAAAGAEAHLLRSA